MTAKRLGMTAIVGKEQRILGIFTDGDLRRAIERQIDFTQATIDQVMTANCKTIRADMLAAEAVQIMESKAINALVVTDDDNKVIGALNMHDLLRAGVV
jgi:arabinose-5-phosphate isomerase